MHHKKKGRVVTSNPITRAVARKNLAAAATSMKIRLYLMVDGEACVDEMEAIGQTLAVVGYASELDPKIGREDTRVRVLRGGLSACKQLMISNRWDSAQTRAIDVALDAALDLNAKVGTVFIAQAVHELALQ